jgi:hypothetical protein
MARLQTMALLFYKQTTTGCVIFLNNTLFFAKFL